MSEELQIEVQESHPVPIYLQIRDQLRDHIKTAGLPRGTALPDVLTLSALAGVSPRTMDRALRELIREGVCFRRPKKGTFVGDGAAETRTVCLVHHPESVSTITDDIVAAGIYHGIRERAARDNVDTVFVTGDLAPALAAYRQFGGVNLRGVLLLRCAELAKMAAAATSAPDMRFVCLGYRPAGFAASPANMTGVFSDDYEGGRELATWLARQGHRRLGILSLALAGENYRLRVAGFTAAAAAAQVPIVWEHELRPNPPVGGNGQPGIARALAAALPDGPDAPTAVMCVNDWLADGLLRGARARGLGLEVTGYDHLVQHLSATDHFTTMAVNYAAIGFQGTDALLRPEPPTAKIVHVPTALVPRTDPTEEP